VPQASPSGSALCFGVVPSHESVVQSLRSSGLSCGAATLVATPPSQSSWKQSSAMSTTPGTGVSFFSVA
jgi:hypothetical protein